jgi:hypothetical protein
LSWALPAAAETVYRGEQTLWQDTVWQGEVLIDGVLTVAPEVVLEIRPGTRISFTFMDSNGDGIGEHEIFIQGRLDAVGTEENPIVFTSARRVPFAGAWGAINMMMSEGDNRLVHCIMEYGYRGYLAHFSSVAVTDCIFRHNVRGLQFQESTVTLRRCLILENFNGLQFRDSDVIIEQSRISGSYWGLRCLYTDLRLTDCVIEDNAINGVHLRDSTLLAEDNHLVRNRRGLYLQRSRAEVRGNHIADNSEHGIFLEDSELDGTHNLVTGNGRSGVRWLNSRGTLRANDLSGNGTYAVINDGNTPLDATGNWWGTADESLIGGLVRDGRQRTGLADVFYDEALTAPPARLPSL